MIASDEKASSDPVGDVSSTTVATATSTRAIVSPASSPFSEVDEAVERVEGQQKKWNALPYAEKEGLLQRCLVALNNDETMKMMEDAGKLRRNVPTGNVYNQRCAEVQVKMMTSVHISMWLSYLRDAYALLASSEGRQEPHSAINGVEELPDGSLLVDVSPNDIISRYAAASARQYLQIKRPQSLGPDVHDKQKILAAVKEIQRKPLDRKPGIVAVLGATNFEAPIDVLHALFCDNKVVIYKMPPQLVPMRATVEKFLAPFIEAGYISVIEGGGAEGEYLLKHPKVSKWYLTGSKSTAYRVLWNQPTLPSPDEQTTVPRVTKPFIAELGGCGAWIVCPGKWTKVETKEQAKTLVQAMLMNGGHICAHPQVLLTCKNWTDREAFLEAVKSELRSQTYVGCWFPNSIEKLLDYADAVAKEHSARDGDKNSWLYMPMNCPISNHEDQEKRAVFCTNCKEDSIFTSREAFLPATGEIPLDTPPTVEDFLTAAVKFANDKLEGRLCATVCCKTANAAEESALASALADLKFGSVGLNTFGLFTVQYPQLHWGSWCPSASRMEDDTIEGAALQKAVQESASEDLHSGVGGFGNVFSFDGVLKSVLKAPFRGLQHTILTPPSGNSDLTKKHKTMTRTASAMARRPPPTAGPLSSLTTLSSLTKMGGGFYFGV